MLIHGSLRAVRLVAALHRACEVALDLSCSPPMALPLVVIAKALTALILIQRHIWLRMPAHHPRIFMMVCIWNHHFWYSILSDTLPDVVYFFRVLGILMFGGLTVE